MTRNFSFKTSQEAWEKLNEYFIFEGDEIQEKYGLRNSAQMIGYDFYIDIFRPNLDPDFDFNKHFNYTTNKWGSLIKNYINLDYLDIFKSEVNQKRKKSGNFNISYLFSNNHVNGKGCLLSLTVAKRPKEVNPRIIVTLRSSEIVKRLMFDLLLIKRIGEYVLGDSAFHLTLILPNLYTQSEVSAMYLTYKPELIKKLKKSKDDYSQKIYQDYKKLKTIDIESIGYKIHQRAAKVIQGQTLNRPLLIKNLQIH